MVIKYLINGQKIEVVKEIDGGYLVSDIYESDSEEYPEYTSTRIYFVEKVFDSAPKEKYDNKIIILKEEIKSLEESRNTLKTQINEIKDNNKQLLLKLKTSEKLKHLEDFIDGKITHYVELGYCPEIIEFKNAVCNCDKKDLKLLVLFGASNGDLYWRLNDYKDGSGVYNTVIPCLSYEEAIETLKMYLISECNKSLNKKQNINSYFITAAKTYGIELPPEYLQKYKEEKILLLNNQKKQNIDSIKNIDLTLEELNKN